MASTEKAHESINYFYINPLATYIYQDIYIGNIAFKPRIYAISSESATYHWFVL